MTRRSSDDSGHPPPDDTCLLIGQSNMAGRAAIEKADETVPERVALFSADGEWIPARNPLNRHSTVRKETPPPRLGPGYTFAIEMTESDPGSTVGLVVNARGGSSISEWDRGSRLYEEAVRRAKAARESTSLRGVLWHQGESDEDDTEYLDKVTDMVTSLRRDLDDPELPFVAGEIAGDHPVNDQISRLPDNVPHTGVVSSEGLELFDDVHFDAASQRELGRRYAAEVRRLSDR